MDATASRPPDLRYSKLHFILKFAKYTAQPGWTFAGSANQRTTGYLAGVGMQYNVNDIVGFRISLDFINYSDAVFSVFMRNVSMLAVFKL